MKFKKKDKIICITNKLLNRDLKDKKGIIIEIIDNNIFRIFFPEIKSNFNIRRLNIEEIDYDK